MDIASLVKDEVILLVEDNERIAALTAEQLRKASAIVHIASTIAEGHEIARREAIDLVLLDLDLPDGSGLDLLAQLRESTPELPAIILTADGNIRSAVEAMRLGAVDYLVKPYTTEAFEYAIERALTMDTLRREIRHLRREAREGRDSPVRGASASMRDIWTLVERVAPTDSNIVITGESGTGKEILARAIHGASLRAGGPFIPVNCGGITETLIEDQLFGHEAHAFTDARALRRGDFELADKGTIFLDEIGEMSMTMQPNLLRVLDSRRFTRIGGERELHADVRVISATHRDLDAAIAAGAFRQDLHFRLNVFTIHLPALRERREDIPLLVAAFLRDMGRSVGKPRRRISERAVRLLLAYDWPGNIRQLRNVIERALILCQGQEITPEHLPPEITGRPDDIQELPDADVLIERWFEAAPFADVGMEAVEQFGRFMIANALRRAGGRRAEAARMLGISPDSLGYYAKKYGLLSEGR